MKLTVDAVVFAYDEENGLRTLLIKRAFKPFLDSYSLAGGFVFDNESTDEAVIRKLSEETNVGLRLTYLEQLYTFSNPNRDPRERIVTVAYYGLINPKTQSLKVNVHVKDVKWVSIDDALQMNLAFDHNEILKYALQRLRNKLRYEPIGFDLLGEYFTLTDIWKMYSSILDKDIDKANFYKKIEKFDILTPTKYKSETGGVGRKAKLYMFNKDRYEILKKEGLFFEI